GLAGRGLLGGRRGRAGGRRRGARPGGGGGLRADRAGDVGGARRGAGRPRRRPPTGSLTRRRPGRTLTTFGRGSGSTAGGDRRRPAPGGGTWSPSATWQHWQASGPAPSRAC